MKRRGSAMLFVVAMIAAMTAALVATVGLTSGALRAERRWEDLLRIRYALEAVTEQAAADFTKGTFTTFPTTRTATVNGVVCSITIENYGAKPHVMQVTAAMTLRGRTVTESKLVGMRKTPSPFVYALFSNGNVIAPGTLATGSSGSNGDVYVRGTASLTGLNNTVNGDLEAIGSITVSSGEVTGTSYPSAAEIPYPTIAAANYSSVASATLTKATLAGYTFPTTADQYYVVFRTGNLSISGSFRGRGTIFVDGAVTFSGATSYFDAASSVAFISTGGITINSTASVVVGFMFTSGAITTPITAVSLTRGSLVGNSMTIGGPLSSANDPLVWLNADEGRKHRLPGFYP